MRFIYHAVSLLGILILPVVSADLTPGSRHLFGGGMALQAGYVQVDNQFGTISGILRGLGGRLHFYLGKHFRAGGAGAAVSLAYDTPGLSGSYFKIGYGGLTAEITGLRNSWRYSAGLLAGGASFSNMHVITRSDGGQFDGYLDDRATFIVSPLLTIEHSLTDAISLMAMADYLWGPELGRRHHLGGPKVHIGILFNK